MKGKRRNNGRDAAVTRKLTAWFEGAARPLPWRRSRNGRRCAWGALVAEAMLQQTQVARVIERFEEFIARFPAPADLARAREDHVLAMWQGLGYYRRARHLHQAAKIIVERFNGRVPNHVDDLLQLPGIGRYTAGAIASIVFGQAEPIVDGNVHRVLTRLDAKHIAASDRTGIAWTWKRAEELVRTAVHPGRFNEALMELGSTVCTPRNPACGTCPIAMHCKAKRSKIQNELPPAKRAASRRSVHHHAVIIQQASKLLFEQRPTTGLWANMWQVPTIESDVPLSIEEVESKLPMAVQSIANGGMFEHQTSHRRITFHVLTARSRSRSGIWREPHDVGDLPMSNAQRRILGFVEKITASPRQRDRGPAQSR